MSISIVDYTSLQTALANWLHRTDLATFIPDFIGLAENQLNLDLDTRFQLTTTTLTTTAGVGYLSLPSDCLTIKRLRNTSTDPIGVLDYMMPEQLSVTFNDPTTAQPEDYTIIGTQIQLGPVPDSTYTLELVYKQMLPALSSSNTNNWLITRFPNIYLWGAILAAQPYLVNDERIPAIAQLYTTAVNQLNGVKWAEGSPLAQIPG